MSGVELSAQGLGLSVSGYRRRCGSIGIGLSASGYRHSDSGWRHRAIGIRLLCVGLSASVWVYRHRAIGIGLSASGCRHSLASGYRDRAIGTVTRDAGTGLSAPGFSVWGCRRRCGSIGTGPSASGCRCRVRVRVRVTQQRTRGKAYQGRALHRMTRGSPDARASEGVLFPRPKGMAAAGHWAAMKAGHPPGRSDARATIAVGDARRVPPCHESV